MESAALGGWRALVRGANKVANRGSRSLSLVVLMAGAWALTSCGGGGGGGSSPAPTASAGGGTGTGTGGSPTSTIATAARGTSGTSPATAQVANASAPNFFDRPLPIFGTAYPLKQSVLVVKGSSVTIDTAANDGGGTLTWGPSSSWFQLRVPGAGIDKAAAQAGVMGENPTDLGAAVWEFLLAGFWFDNPTNRVAAFIAGYQTPANAMPKTGSATYGGVANVQGLVFTSSGKAVVLGNANLTANFSSGSIDGRLTNMAAIDANGSATPWNDISAKATLDAGASSFSGTTSSSSAPSTAFALKSNATGTISGGFYGPHAEDVGAVWTLGDGSVSAFGTFGGRQTPFAVGSPAAPSVGTSAAAFQVATAGGPTFDKSSGTYAIGAFPLTQTTLVFSSSGFLAAPTSTSASATMTVIGSTTCGAGCQYITQYNLAVPSANIDTTRTIPGDLANSSTSDVTTFNGPVQNTYDILHIQTYGLSYTAFGQWASTKGALLVPDTVGAFAYGYQTPVTAMPTIGTATYSNTGGVVGGVFIPLGGGISGTDVSGDVSLTANFATGSVNGAFTNMKVDSGAQTAAWNNVSVAANIASGTSTFSGATAATSAPANNAYALKASATGAINGGFYGPNAEELGAVWTLSNNDGTGSAIGTVGARK